MSVGKREANSKRTGCGALLTVSVPWAVAISNGLTSKVSGPGLLGGAIKINVHFHLNHSNHPADLGSVADMAGLPTYHK